MLPILPHLSSSFSVVLSPQVTAGLSLDANHKALLSVDGHINLPIAGGSVVVVKRNASRIRFLRVHPEASFYGSLDKKLRGKH